MAHHLIIKLFITLVTIAGLSACISLHTGVSAHAQLISKSGSKVSGNIVFQQLTKGVEISGKVSGLKPNQLHGFHIHDKGDCLSIDALSAGGHFNPEGKKHGHQTAHYDHQQGAEHHAGDMPNLKADADGTTVFRFVLLEIAINDGPKSITGRAVIVHANEDDYVSQPVGNAGGRIACGLIQ
jgi:superoxide dismutase, Cu-Zn family